MSLLSSIDQLLGIMTFVMVPIALGIISVKAIRDMIWLYQAQSVVLALLTVFIAVELEGNLNTRIFLIAFALLIPALLAYIIEPLLAQATVPEAETPWLRRLAPPFLRLINREYQADLTKSIQKALPIWAEHSLSSSRQLGSVLFSLLLTTGAYIVAFSIGGVNQRWIPILVILLILVIFSLSRLVVSITISLLLIIMVYIAIFNLIPMGPDWSQSLAVSMTLLMLGIFTMISREDIISQIIGLLVMDHGLFLATVRVITHPQAIPIFVIGLFLYILITLVILVFLLPELHAKSATIQVAEQDELQG